MGEWLVRRQTGGWAHNPKEIDQFWNERASLLESVVREAIQNSLDARRDGADIVRVRIALRHLDDTRRKRLTESYMLVDARDQSGDCWPFIEHLRAGGVAANDWDPSSSCYVLIIEDYGTRGLEGPFDRAPDQNSESSDFYNFVHALGVTSKRGRARGRHGLGKLAFPASSACRTFFALTRRASDDLLLLAGLSLLRYRQLRRDGSVFSFEAGAWFGERREENGDFELPLAGGEAEAFGTVFGLDRKEPGLSVFVPWVSECPSEEDILRVVLENYFVAIHADRLHIEVGGRKITSGGLREACANYARDAVPPHVLDFLEEALTLPDDGYTDIPFGLLEKDRQSLEKAEHEILRRLEDIFERGDVVAVRIRLRARRKDGTEAEGILRAFLQRPEGVTEGRALVVRDDLLLPEEARWFARRRALALLLSRDDGIAEFLGDAENPAHRGWNASSEHVRERWRSAGEVIRRIRQILPRLYDLLTGERAKDETVLARFFPKSQREGGEKPAVPKPPKVEESDMRFRIVSVSEDDRAGFRVASKNASPGRYEVLVWMLDVDRRRRYDPFDFDLADESSFTIRAKGCDVIRRSQNVIAFVVDQYGSVDLTVIGFDPHRDLHVEVRRTESAESE